MNRARPITFSSLVLLTALLAAPAAAPAGDSPPNANTDWLKAARHGVFMHFLPGDARAFAQVEDFDVEALADQLQAIGAKYFFITMYQNSGYINAPNSVYDALTGYAPGEKCARRDLPLALSDALKPRGIKLMLYVTAQTPNQDARAQKAFGLPQGKRDQPIDVAFAREWAKVIREWSDRYGDRVSGWWFDGAYQEPVHFNEEIAAIYAEAAKHGNPAALVTFNPGVKLIRYTKAEDYTAGELNEPLSVIPESRFVDGSQWHALTFLGSSWMKRDTRFSDPDLAAWMSKVLEREGVVTLDMGPNYDPKAGPIGTLSEAQMKQARAVQAARREAQEKPTP